MSEEADGRESIASVEAAHDGPLLPLPDWWDAPLPGVAEESVVAAEPIRVPASTIDGLLGQVGEWMAAHGRVEQPVRELASFFREIGRTIDRLQRQLRELELEAESSITPPPRPRELKRSGSPSNSTSQSITCVSSSV